MSETIKDIIKDIRENDGMCISPTSLFDFDEDGGILLGDLAERIKVARVREMAAKDAEIEKLRALVKGLLEAATVDCATCCYDYCGPNRENCIVHEAAMYLEESEAKND